MTDKISIIIPVYNTGFKLIKCLDSIINQTYSNIEILVIDDGSKDNSSNICKSFAKKDKRIKYIKKSNSGVSDTRNLGIKESTGTYIIFIDSDDYISFDYIEKMYINLKNNNTEIIVSGLQEVDENYSFIKEVVYLKETKVLDFEDYFTDFINKSYFTCVKMLFNKKLLMNNFNNNLSYGEDMLFAYELIKNNKITYLSNSEYYYVQNNKSLTHNYTVDSIDKYISDNVIVFDKFLYDNSCYETIIANRLLTKINMGLSRLLTNKKISYKEFIKLITKYKSKINNKSIELKKINYVSKLGKIKLFILHNNFYFIYYILCKMKNTK